MFEQSLTQQLPGIFIIICIAYGKPQNKCFFLHFIMDANPTCNCDIGSGQENFMVAHCCQSKKKKKKKKKKIKKVKKKKIRSKQTSK